MELRPLGETGLKVSRLGAGLVEIGRMLTLSDEAQAGRVLNAALDGGVNFLDTAECYGVSEELIGRTVSHRRREFVLATKVGHVTGGYRGEPWTARTVKDSIDRSLKLMRTDYLDLVQLHAWDMPDSAREQVVLAVRDAQDAGKARFLGYSHENEGAEWGVDSGCFDTLQTVMSIVDQRARYGLLERAKSRGMGVIVKRPLANGMWARRYVRSDYYSDDGVAEKLRERAEILSAMGPIHGAPDDPIELSWGSSWLMTRWIPPLSGRATPTT